MAKSSPSKPSRKTPAEIVAASRGNRGPASWYDRLPIKDREFVQLVVREARKCPDASITDIAVALVEELTLTVTRTTVITTLRSMINAKA